MKSQLLQTGHLRTGREPIERDYLAWIGTWYEPKLINKVLSYFSGQHLVYFYLTAIFVGPAGFAAPAAVIVCLLAAAVVGLAVTFAEAAVDPVDLADPVAGWPIVLFLAYIAGSAATHFEPAGWLF